MDKYIIELTEQQLNIIMEGLGEIQFKRAFSVFNEINNQYIAQKQASKPAGEEDK